MSNWNGKVKCTRGVLASIWKENKTYNVVNGKVEQEDGCYTRRFNNFKDFQDNTLSKFEEVLNIPQPHKSLLKSGMKVVCRNGDKRYVLIPTNSLHTFAGEKVNELSKYTDNLLNKVKLSGELDIMEIYDVEILIAKREEKSAKDTKIEELEKRMRELADEIAKLKGE